MSEEEFEELLRMTKGKVNNQNLKFRGSELGFSIIGISPYETVIDVLTELRGLEDEAHTKWWALEEINQQE